MAGNLVTHYNQCEPAGYIKQLVLYGRGHQAENENNSLIRRVVTFTICFWRSILKHCNTFFKNILDEINKISSSAILFVLLPVIILITVLIKFNKLRNWTYHRQLKPEWDRLTSSTNLRSMFPFTAIFMCVFK